MTVLLTSAARSALRTRTKVGVDSAESLNVFDSATALGFEIRFIDLPSVEGMYVSGEPPAIIVSSLRPMGRQIYTCAHEIGHHILGHGEIIDGLLETRSTASVSDPKEREADIFAAYFLMPPSAVDHAFHVRGASYNLLDPLMVFRIANYFQVGYTTLVRHLQFSLKKISGPKAEVLLRATPSQLRAIELGMPWAGNMYVVDKFWNARAPLDCEIGDALVFLGGAIAESTSVVQRESNSTRTVVEAVSRGQAQVQIAGGTRFTVRVAPKQYVGRLEFRWEQVSENEA